jgi:predicted RNA-binding protein
MVGIKDFHPEITSRKHLLHNQEPKSKSMTEYNQLQWLVSRTFIQRLLVASILIVEVGWKKTAPNSALYEVKFRRDHFFYPSLTPLNGSSHIKKSKKEHSAMQRGVYIMPVLFL